MGWTHGQNERREILDKEARRLQKTRKTRAKMGGLCGETGTNGNK